MSTTLLSTRPQAAAETFDLSAESLHSERPVHAGVELVSNRSQAFRDELCRLRENTQEDVLLRPTGGCLGSVLDERVVKAVFLDAFSDFKGVSVPGATSSLSLSDPSIHRSSVPEIASQLEQIAPHSQVLGLVPGESLERRKDMIRVASDVVGSMEYDIVIPQHSGCVAYSEERTGYFWNAEPDLAFQIWEKMDEISSLKHFVTVAFDGGQGVEYELRTTAHMSLLDSRIHLLLVRGGEENRTTESLIRDQSWLRDHPNVHVLEPNEVSRWRDVISS